MQPRERGERSVIEEWPQRGGGVVKERRGSREGGKIRELSGA